MSKYNIEVEIPDGKYCHGGVNEPEISCNYIGDSTASSAGLCSLISGGDCLLSYEDQKDWRIVKHKNCPGLKAKVDTE